MKGLIAETPSTALAFLEQALKAAPQFDRARLAIWDLHSEASDHLKALDAISAIRPESRFFARGAIPPIAVADEPEAVRRCVADVARDADAKSRRRRSSNAIGVAELRRATTLQPGRATYYFSQASELDPADGDLFFNLGYAYWLDKDPKAAIYWLREAVRRDPGDGDAHFILGVALQQTGATSEATRERELATRLSSKYADGRGEGRCRRRSRCRAGSSGCTKSCCRRAPASTASSRPRASAIRRTSRPSISMPAAARSSAKPIAKRSRNCGARSICRRTSPKRTCCSGACICAAAVRRRPSRR